VEYSDRIDIVTYYFSADATTMSKRKRRLRLCRICRKNPIWHTVDVKHPGPVCKRCYHAHVWPDRPSERKKRKEMQRQAKFAEELANTTNDPEELPAVLPDHEPPYRFSRNGG
jgi:hypothetical protein